MNILLSCYSFGAGRGSEAGVGWNIARELALRGHQLWLVTTSEFHQINSEALSQDAVLAQRIHLIEQDLGITRFALASSYKRWQKGIAPTIAQLCQQEPIDIMHHLTFNQYRYLYDLFESTRPYLCGPLGGAECVDLRLLLSLWRDLPLKYMAKELWRHLPFDALCLAWRSRKAAAQHLYLCSSPQTQKRLRQIAGIDSNLQSIIAIREEEICPNPQKEPAQDKAYFIDTGGLRPEKGPSLLLQAFALCWQQQPQIRLCMTGIAEGDRAKLQNQLSRLGLDADAVIIYPFLPRAELHQLMRFARAFLCFNLRDSGCMALLEALALGLPSICLDNPEQHWLPAHFARKIKPQGKGKFALAQELAEHMLDIAHAPAPDQAWHQARVAWLREQMSWSKRVDYIETQYKRILAHEETTHPF